MGSGGTLFGLAVYRGDVGFDFHRRVQREELAEEEALYGQDALTLVFADRQDLSKPELRRLREHGRSFRGRGRWPQFRSHTSGRLPVELTEAEAQRMLHTIRQAIHLCVDKRDEVYRSCLEQHGIDPNDPDPSDVDDAARCWNDATPVLTACCAATPDSTCPD